MTIDSKLFRTVLSINLNFSVITCNPYSIKTAIDKCNATVNDSFCKNFTKVVGYPLEAMNLGQSCMPTAEQNKPYFYDSRLCNYPHYFYYSVIAGSFDICFVSTNTLFDRFLDRKLISLYGKLQTLLVSDQDQVGPILLFRRKSLSKITL